MNPAHAFNIVEEDSLTLSTINVNDSVFNGVSPGVYPISLTVTLKNFTMVKITKSFLATITCEVFSIAVNKAPKALTQY